MITPQRYLNDLISSDRGPEHNEVWMTDRLQQRWPGNYKVVKDIDYQWQSVEYNMVFDTPEDRTMFILKWG